MNKIADKKTTVKKNGEWFVVSTIKSDMEIGYERNCETMVFPSDENGQITDFSEVFFTGHGFATNVDELHAQAIKEFLAE